MGGKRLPRYFVGQKLRGEAALFCFPDGSSRATNVGNDMVHPEGLAKEIERFHLQNVSHDF